jgi:hypothetical protein
MKSFWLDVILKPLAAMMFCLVFGLPFVYTGFQSVAVSGSKDESGAVSIDFTRKHFWGLWQVREHIENVQNATLKTSLIHRSNPRRVRLVSGVFIETEDQAIRLLAGSSNIDDNLKREAVNSLNAFIADPAQDDYAQTFRIANIFGWVGLPFLILGVWGLLAWPSSIIRQLKK